MTLSKKDFEQDFDYLINFLKENSPLFSFNRI